MRHKPLPYRSIPRCGCWGNVRTLHVLRYAEYQNEAIKYTILAIKVLPLQGCRVEVIGLCRLQLLSENVSMKETFGLKGRFLTC